MVSKHLPLVSPQVVVVANSNPFPPVVSSFSLQYSFPLQIILTQKAANIYIFNFSEIFLETIFGRQDLPYVYSYLQGSVIGTNLVVL